MFHNFIYAEEKKISQIIILLNLLKSKKTLLNNFSVKQKNKRIK